MNELRAILDEVAAAGAGDEPAVLATVVGVRGSAYRGIGARRVMGPDGEALGLVSGGCLEADLARRAWALTEGGRAAVVRYDSTDPDGAWAFGLGCRGVIDILVERVEGATPAWVAFAIERLDRHEPVALARVLKVGAGDGRARLGSFLAADAAGAVVHDLADGRLVEEVAEAARAGLRAGRSGPAGFDGPGGGVAAVVEVVEPPPTLIVCGAGPDALPLVRLARELGWTVAVADGRHRPATRGRFAAADEVLTLADVDRLRALASRPGASAVVMTHNVAEDARFLALLLDSPIGYVGLLGPKHRAEWVLADLGDRAESARGRLRAPVGLDLGAETPAEIALAIVAEVRATLADRTGGPLRDRDAPIHDREPAGAPSGRA